MPSAIWPRQVSAGELGDDLLLGGEATLLVLGEDDLAVDAHVELATAAVLERGIDAGLLLDLGRETRGPGFVVSNHAVGDDDLHEGQGAAAQGGSQRFNADALDRSPFLRGPHGRPYPEQDREFSRGAASRHGQPYLSAIAVI